MQAHINKIYLVCPPDSNDFKTSSVTIIIPPDEDSLDVVDFSAPIVIVDDATNEASEQVFIVQLQLISSINPRSVDLTRQSASLCRIIDNDG